MIITMPPGTVSPEEKKAITKRGLIVIETDEPEKVKLIDFPVHNSFKADAYFMSALKALTTSTPTSKQEHFINTLYERLTAIEKD